MYEVVGLDCFKEMVLPRQDRITRRKGTCGGSNSGGKATKKSSLSEHGAGS